MCLLGEADYHVLGKATESRYTRLSQVVVAASNMRELKSFSQQCL